MIGLLFIIKWNVWHLKRIREFYTMTRPLALIFGGV